MGDQGNYKRRVHFCTYFLSEIHGGYILEPKLTPFTDGPWFHLSGYINAQNNR
jgi:hypothetical protein